MELEIPDHAADRLIHRGVTLEEVVETIANGREAEDVAPGAIGRVSVFPFRMERKGRWYEEKEVAVYWKEVAGRRILLTVKTRFGSGFPRLR